MSAAEFVAWLDDRLALDKLRELGKHKTVPVHRYTVFYYLGGMTLFFFLVQVMTGILLMLYYRPSAEEAFESVEFIMTTVPFGWLIRSIHSWSANLMVFFAFVHLVTVFFMKAYRPPREITWVTGCLLLFLAMGFGFSGYLLPWNQLAFFATKVGTDIAGSVPFIGEWLLRFLRGGDRVTGGTLARFYGWHVAILPAITTVVLITHVVLVQMKGMSVPPKTQGKREMKFFPHFAIRDLFGWIVALGVLAALAALMPWELGDKADPFAPAYEDIRPEWYFVFMFQTLKFVPGGEIFHVEYEAIAIILFSLGGLLMVLVPFLDRDPDRRLRSRLFTLGGALTIAFMVVMTIWGYASLLPLYIVLGTVALLLLIALATRPHALAVLVTLLAAGAVAAAPPPQQTSCTTCHDTVSLEHDIHAKANLGCHDCHGGDPSMSAAEDPMAAMDPSKGYIGKPDRKTMPEFCGRCHSSLPFMRRFQPQARVDQVAEYWTSRHGQAVKRGDEDAATCIDCHGVHGIRAASDPESPVYPSRVVATCGRCHSDAKRMAGHQDAHGNPMPVDQQEMWTRSVHAKSMKEHGDLSAPTCNDCHGNHGATPPGVESVAFVCGNCHGRESELFRASGRHEGFACMTCHSNHAVVRPTVALLGFLPETPCAFCHEGLGRSERHLEKRAELLTEAQRLGLKDNKRFDWMIERALMLPDHAASREFTHLFDKFRLGRTSDVVANCTDCHEADSDAGRVAQGYVKAMQEVTSLTARAERTLLTARRGGVEVRSIRPELDQAIDSQIELEVLVHTFNRNGAFAEKHKEGVTHATAALNAGTKSLEELSYRRRGLTIALGFIVLVLIGLGAKIRELSGRDS